MNELSYCMASPAVFYSMSDLAVISFLVGGFILLASSWSCFYQGVLQLAGKFLITISIFNLVSYLLLYYFNELNFIYSI